MDTLTYLQAVETMKSAASQYDPEKVVEGGFNNLRGALYASACLLATGAIMLALSTVPTPVSAAGTFNLEEPAGAVPMTDTTLPFSRSTPDVAGSTLAGWVGQPDDSNIPYTTWISATFRLSIIRSGNPVPVEFITVTQTSEENNPLVFEATSPYTIPNGLDSERYRGDIVIEDKDQSIQYVPGFPITVTRPSRAQEGGIECPPDLGECRLTPATQAALLASGALFNSTIWNLNDQASIVRMPVRGEDPTRVSVAEKPDTVETFVEYATGQYVIYKVRPSWTYLPLVMNASTPASSSGN